MKEGEKIYVESVMTDEEYAETGKKFKHSTKKPPYFKSEFDWRWRMGGGLTPFEIKLIGERLDILLKTVKL
jgi:hypothetical protein